MSDFVINNKGIEINKSNVDEFVVQKEQDGQTIIDEIKCKEHSIEDAIDLWKKTYRKKGIDLSTYLDTIRDLAEEQFFNLAMKDKILGLISGIPKPQ